MHQTGTANGAPRVIPEWSGGFVEVEGEDMGLMPIHLDDDRTHQPPPGWTYSSDFVDYDSHVMVYRRLNG